MNIINSSHLSVYIPMLDGVKIALDIFLPEIVSSDNKVPVLVEFTRYWRIIEGKAPKDRVSYFPTLGFAHAIVDCRGSGASFGCRQAEQSVAEVKDFAYVIEWLAEQPWSNGEVVSIGSSYSANTAEFSMIDAPVALKASIPRFSDFDIYNNLLFPGGLLNKVFIRPWGEGIHALDMNNMGENLAPTWDDYRYGSVKPIDSDQDRALLEQAIADHQANLPLHKYLASIEYRDDFHFASELGQEDDRWVSPHLVQNNPRLKQVPSYHWASFNDAGTAAGSIARFMGSNTPMRVIIGYWSHGAEFDTNPYKSKNENASPDPKGQFDHIAQYLAGLQSPDDTRLERLSERALYYYTAGENVWKKTDVWPPNGIDTLRWYFSEKGTLSVDKPLSSEGKDLYCVDFEVGTGKYTRWNQMTPELQYGDRAEVDKRLLTYTSEPLKDAVEITGSPVIWLSISSTLADGAVIVYLEAVAPDGLVTMLTEGGLRLIHRKISNEIPPYPVFGPYHTFERKDSMPMPVGQLVEVGFDLLPLSVRIEEGYAIRVAVAGHDKDCFDRVPLLGEQTYEIYRHLGALSYIDIPLQTTNCANGEMNIVDPFLW